MSDAQPMEMESDGGDSRYTNVIFRKKEGEVIVTSTNMTFASNAVNDPNTPVTTITIDWNDVVKHQVSPVTYPKSLLKVILAEKSNGSNKNTALTFQLRNRIELEQIRKEITRRLQNAGRNGTNGSKKRPFSETVSKSPSPPLVSTKPTSFGDLDPTAVAVTRASLLAANPALRKQHKHLVEETKTVEEEDFWETHRHLLEEEYARISGMARAGTSSVLQSHLPSTGRVTLGVQEMRQIFILYPAVHKAYEEKVPLELSDEQFWRKYLESEYFHRDRGRIGTAARNHAPAETENKNTQKDQKKKPTGPSFEQQEARAAAVGTDDIFSRYDQKLRAETAEQNDSSQRHWGRRLAVGQFDLASTFETERGHILEGPKDNHPSNQADGGKGARVVQKYNRHWAMVLHPEQAIAGADLMEVARRSVVEVLPGDSDAKASGGVDEEMLKLVGYAQASGEDANHAAGTGADDGDQTETLTLKNVEAYYAGQVSREKDGKNKESEEELARRHSLLSQHMASKMKNYATSIVTEDADAKSRLSDACFPAADLGRDLLAALTKKMANDSKKEQAASLEMVKNLPEDFRERLQSYFRRSSELLRHFFGLRKLEQDGGGNSAHTSQKLARIVRGMETFYREMEVMRRDLPQTETGEMMRKMCLPIMDQLDWAFKLHREGSGGGGGGGFVAVEEL